jgi:hypothetical protein
MKETIRMLMESQAVLLTSSPSVMSPSFSIAVAVMRLAVPKLAASSSPF